MNHLQLVASTTTTATANAVATTATPLLSSCKCSVTSPLQDFHAEKLNGCLEINLTRHVTGSSSAKAIKELTSSSFSSSVICVDPSTFGVGCNTHWMTAYNNNSDGIDGDDDFDDDGDDSSPTTTNSPWHHDESLWSSSLWCFIEDLHCPNIDEIIDIDILSTNWKGIIGISHMACSSIVESGINTGDGEYVRLQLEHKRNKYNKIDDADYYSMDSITTKDEKTKQLRSRRKGDDDNKNEQTTTSKLSGRYDDNFAMSSSTLGWEFAGPTTYVLQFGPDSSKLASSGAVQNVVEGNPGTWFLGSVNGGIWRTTSLQSEFPHWTNVLDRQPGITCSSMSALHVSKINPNRIYGGCGGSTSSEQGYDWNVMNSGDWSGIMRSIDGGDTWNMIHSFPTNYYVTDILEIPYENKTILLVSAQSHLYDRDDGGIWQSIDGGRSFHKVDGTPTFTLTELEDKTTGDSMILATHARTSQRSVSISVDGGSTFHNFGHHLPWDDNAVPFYTCSALLGNGRIVVAGLTRLGSFPNNTNSQFFISDDTSSSMSSWSIINQPMSMDQDSMPKDRMALLADPEFDDLLYVAGNAEALAWRVNVTTGIWTKMWDQPDVIDGSIPHGDCRNFAWDSIGSRLLLVTDGGIFAREKPREPGGVWVSLNGDYSSLELLSAHYDPKNDRYVAGAQDNCAMVTKANATPGDVAYGFVDGDGTVTLVDSSSTPSRLFGTTQFLGVGTIENDPDAMDHSSDDDDDDDDDGCGGLCFVQGDKFIEVPLDKYFPEPSSFPFFVQPYTLNRQDPTSLLIWTNGTGPERPSAFYEFNIPYTVQNKDDIGPPTKLFETPPGVMIMDFVSGGYTAAGESDPDLILAISNTHLYECNKSDEGDEKNASIIERALPVDFAFPVTLEYDYANNGARILGPLTHARTVSFTVSPSDSSIIAVTGWPSVENNLGDEVVFLSTDTGRTWRNVTGNLRAASRVCGKIRPGGLLLVDLDDSSRALLVGTSNGILVTFLESNLSVATQVGSWIRLGSLEEFPIVLTADVDYEPSSDRLIAATFGRGIYVLNGAKQKLIDTREGMASSVGLSQ